VTEERVGLCTKGRARLKNSNKDEKKRERDISNTYYIFLNISINMTFSGKKIMFTTGYL